MSNVLKNAFTIVIHYLYENVLYFLKLKIKEGKEIQILKSITDFWTIFPAQENMLLE